MTGRPRPGSGLVAGGAAFFRRHFSTFFFFFKLSFALIARGLLRARWRFLLLESTLALGSCDFYGGADDDDGIVL